MTEAPDAAPRPRPRPRWRSWLISLACFVAGLFSMLVLFALTVAADSEQLALTPARVVTDAVIGILCCVLVGFGHRRPAIGLLVAALIPFSFLAFPAGVLSLVRLGEFRSWRLDAVTLALFGVGNAAMAWWDRAGGEELGVLLSGLALSLVFGAMCLFWGHSRGTRAALLDSLRAQAVGARREHLAIAREHHAEVARVRAEERAAIARDMHDSLSHQLSLVALHAGALAYRDDLTTDQRKQAARTLRDAAGTASAELREVLSSLRGAEEYGAAVQPLPDAGSLPELVERARADGQPVSLHWRDVDPQDLELGPRAVTVAYARIARELLVNAAKHAPGQPVSLVLGRDADRLLLTASNPLGARGHTALGTGLGLVGVAERARLLGGTMEAGAEDGRFTVRVEMPWRRRESEGAGE